MYSDKVMKHFKKPENMGELKEYSGKGDVGNPACGDMMSVWIKVEKDKNDVEVVKDIKFKTFGCVAAIATSSVLTTLVKGKTLEEAAGISKDDIAKSLDGLPPIKLHCSVLAVDALKKAIEDYKVKSSKNK